MKPTYTRIPQALAALAALFIMSGHASAANLIFSDPQCISYTATAASNGDMTVTCNRSTTTQPPSGATPQCSVSANPATLPAPGTVVLTASCTPAATSYSWTNAGGNTNTSTVSVSATSSYSVTGSNAAGAGNTASVTVTVAPVTASACGKLNVINDTIDWNAGNPVTMYSNEMKTGSVYVYRMTTGSASSALDNLSIAEFGGSVPVRTLVISKTACDFNLDFAVNPYDVGKQATAYFSVGAANAFGYPVLQPNTTYFVSIKNEDQFNAPGVDSCLADQNCRFILALRH